MHREPDVGFDPGSPGSRPGPKAGAKPLRHPGIPEIGNFQRRNAGKQSVRLDIQSKGCLPFDSSFVTSYCVTMQRICKNKIRGGKAGKAQCLPHGKHNTNLL